VVSYERTTGVIRDRMNARNRVDEAKLARELGDAFRGNYRRAEAIARGDGS
jgi:superfamily II DNA helicase RecQ